MDSLDDRWIQDPIFDDLEAAQESMHIPELASAWLEVLSEAGGLPDISTTTMRIGGKPLNRPMLEDPANTPSDPNTFPARLENGQVVWVKLDERMAGNHSVFVVNKPKKDKAILAALTIMESETVNIEKLREFLPLVDISHPVGVSEGVYEAFSSLINKREGSLAMDLLRGFPTNSVRYALALLRYYRPDFDALPEEEKRGLLITCCERINQTIAATRQLAEFLEYGAPDRDQRPMLENPIRDVKAAVLRDVENKNNRQIAEVLEVNVSEKSKHVGDFSAVGKMVSRGRSVLERAFGKNGWCAKAADMRVEYVRRSALSRREGFIEDMAEAWGVSSQAAQSALEGEDLISPEEVERRSKFHLASIRGHYASLAENEDNSA